MNNNELEAPPHLGPSKPSLSELFLFANKISVLPKDYFKCCQKLSHVKLNNNNLVTLPDFHWLHRELRVLHVNKNKLQSLTGLESRKNYSRFRLLHLHHNDISDFNVTYLRYMPCLGGIHLHDNNITSIADWRPYKYRLEWPRMILHRNPWDCSKDLHWAFGKTSRELALTKPFLCFTPKCHHSKLLNDIGNYFSRKYDISHEIP